MNVDQQNGHSDKMMSVVECLLILIPKAESKICFSSIVLPDCYLKGQADFSEEVTLQHPRHISSTKTKTQLDFYRIQT